MVALTGGSEEREPDDGAEGPGPLLVVTPAELELLEDAHAAHLGLEGPAGGPADGQGQGRPPARGRAGRTEALRSLQGRGVLDAQARLVAGSAVADLVLVLLDVRVSAQALLVVERRLAGSEHQADLRLLHLVESGGVVEDLHPQGWHALDLCLEPAELADRALEPMLPPDAAPGGGEPITLDTGDPDPSTARLSASVLAELTLVRPDGRPEASVLLAVGERGCHLAHREDLDEATRRGSGALVFTPVAPDTVRELVRGWVRRVVTPADPDGPTLVR
ncbi:hypothetical protein [Serinicoccus kebangsaanensis]|uniref:hypothetical protein n=1 Tax=Serinicoccus kebangsaanensis TaxID=2602069 RepID=UPI00124DAF3B|nr:hypothetical protein [Serinicoccus kebangsaanensis]